MWFSSNLKCYYIKNIISIFFRYYSVSFFLGGSDYISLYCLIFSQSVNILFNFYFSLFPLSFILGNLKIDLSSSSLILSSGSSSLVLNPLLKFSTYFLLFSSMISACIFKNIFYVLKFSFCSCIALLTLVSIFMTTILNSLSGK